MPDLSNLCANCSKRPRDGRHRLCFKCRRYLERCKKASESSPAMDLDFCVDCKRETPRSWLNESGVCRPCRRINKQRSDLIRSSLPAKQPNIIVFGDGEIRIECSEPVCSNIASRIHEPIMDIRRLLGLHKNSIRRIEFL